MANVPAIIYVCHIIPFDHPDNRFDGMRESIIVFEYRVPCECCGELHEEMVAVWDFNFDRSCDFFLPYGVYSNARMIDEGITAYLELAEQGGQVQ